MVEKKRPFESYTKYALTDKDIERVLQKCNTLEKEVLIRLAIFFGFRRDDIRKIQIQNIDLKNSRITYYEEKKDRMRTLPFNDEIKLMLEKYINSLPKTQKNLFKRNGSATIYRRFQEILADAGLDSRPFHALRGTCYKQWRKKGKPVEQVAYLLGDTVETAIKHYGEATLDELEEMVK